MNTIVFLQLTRRLDMYVLETVTFTMSELYVNSKQRIIFK